jgi:hypothetical protein
MDTSDRKDKKFGPYNIEVTNQECVFLYYMVNLMMSALSGIRYDRSTGIDLDKISMRHGVDYLGQIIDVVNKTIEDAAGRDKKLAEDLLDTISKKVTSKMNT